MKYFICAINNISGKPMPIMDGDNISLFDSRKEAIGVAQSMPLCRSCGYEIFEWGNCF